MKPYKNISYRTRLFLTILLVFFFNFFLTIIPLPGLEKESIKTFFASYYMKQSFSVCALGIKPLLTAYFILTSLYFLLGKFKKKIGLQNYTFQKILLILLCVLLSVLCFSRYYPELVGRQNQSKINLPFLTSFFIYFSLTASVLVGYFIIRIIDRLGAVDGALVIKLMIPALFIRPFLAIKSIWNNQFLQLPDNNSRLAWILLFGIILAGLFFLFKHLWNRDFFFCKIPLKTGKELTIPIYMAGLFFFHFPEMVMLALQIIFMRPSPSPSFLIKIASSMWLFPVKIISGYLLYIYLGRLVINFNAIGEKLGESATPQKIFNLTYKRFGRFQLALSVISFFFILLNQRIKHLPLIHTELSLIIFLLNYFLLILILFLEWGTHRKIIKGNYSAVFQTARMDDFLAAQVLLAENGINAISHQHGYNYIYGYGIGPLSEKTIFISETEKAKALTILGEMNRGESQ